MQREREREREREEDGVGEREREKGGTSAQRELLAGAAHLALEAGEVVVALRHAVPEAEVESTGKNRRC